MDLRILIVLLTGSVCLGSGCQKQDRWQSNRPPVAPASGVLLHDGQPVGQAVLTLHPVTGSYAASAKTDDHGRFQLTTFEPKDGAVPGEYKVTATCLKIDYERDPSNPEVAPPLYHAEQSLLPDSYGDPVTTELQLVIPESGNQEITLQVTGSQGKLRVFGDRRKK